MKNPREAQALEDLVEALAAKVRRQKQVEVPRRATHTTSVDRRYDSITRDCIRGRIRRLAKMYQLHWLVEQATFNKGGIDNLSDGETAGLLQDMERARECLLDGTGFDDAGLVRDVSPRVELP